MGSPTQLRINMKSNELKGKIKQIEKKLPKYLHERDLKSLDTYVYHGADYTLIENFLNPFWTWFASFFPDWMAPNMITLIGLIINVVSSLIVLYHDPTVEGKAPSWVYVLASFSLVTYLNFDCADGKQARRLNASSPLGQLFDHGCDAINEVFILIVLSSACGTGHNAHASLVMIVQCLGFSLAQVLEYHINVLVVGNKYFGTTESILLVSLVYLVAGLFGVDSLRTPLASLLPFNFPFKITVAEFVMEITNIGMLLTIAQLFAGGLRSGSLIPENERGEKNLTRKDYVMRAIPSL